MTMETTDVEKIRAAVRDRYGKAATAAGNSGGPTAGPAVGGSGGDQVASFGASLYDSGDLAALPDSAVSASLGCGNPMALAELKPGQVVLDLGSGGGIDVLLSARRVAPGGKAYGLDMTLEMHELAKRNQAEAGVTNAEFLLGTIEEIPLPTASIDVIISNCVVNLSGDKPTVLAEAFRVLRPGGRLAISDLVLTRPLPAHLAGLVGLWVGCVAGAFVADDLRAELEAAGFADVSIQPTQVFRRPDLLALADQLDPALVPANLDREATLRALDGVVTSSFIRAAKPT
jgi:SAM-dependent methyltransferase